MGNQTTGVGNRPPFNIPKLSDIRSKFTIPKFDKTCQRCEKKLVKNTDRPFSDLICSDCLAIWTQIENILDVYARGKSSAKIAGKLQIWGGLFDAK